MGDLDQPNYLEGQHVWDETNDTDWLETYSSVIDDIVRNGGIITIEIDFERNIVSFFSGDRTLFAQKKLAIDKTHARERITFKIPVRRGGTVKLLDSPGKPADRKPVPSTANDDKNTQ